jgi:hypothetical protein
MRESDGGPTSVLVVGLLSVILGLTDFDGGVFQG